jgi:hypothetical protein
MQGFMPILSLYDSMRLKEPKIGEKIQLGLLLMRRLNLIAVQNLRRTGCSSNDTLASPSED